MCATVADCDDSVHGYTARCTCEDEERRLATSRRELLFGYFVAMCECKYDKLP